MFDEGGILAMTEEPKGTPLREEHIQLGARMGPFGGWNMPIHYRGIVEEHLHTRRAASLFDTCHQGQFLLSGEKAPGDLDRLVTCSIESLKVGQCRYGFLLDDSGKILDDLIVYRLHPTEFMLVVNASTTAGDAVWIKGHLSPGTKFEDVSGKMAKLDLQGPESKAVLSPLVDIRLEALPYYYFKTAKLAGVEMVISRTGYTGELGYEFYFPASAARDVWRRLLRDDLVQPAGLGARDTLRLEMGYPLYGQDIDRSHTPVEAGSGHRIFLKKDFIGKSAIAGQMSTGPSEVLMGLLLEGRQTARSGFPVLYNGQKAGTVTSGSFSPSLKRAVGLAYIRSDLNVPGTKLAILSNGKELRAEVAPLPFYKQGSLRKGG